MRVTIIIIIVIIIIIIIIYYLYSAKYRLNFRIHDLHGFS